jgi:hypothetical protein
MFRWLGALSAPDFRKLIAIILLGGSGVAMTVFGWRLATLLAYRSNGPWPIAYALYGTLFIILSVVTGISALLGRRASSFNFSKDGVSGTSDAECPPDAPMEPKP